MILSRNVCSSVFFFAVALLASAPEAELFAEESACFFPGDSHCASGQSTLELDRSLDGLPDSSLQDWQQMPPLFFGKKIKEKNQIPVQKERDDYRFREINTCPEQPRLIQFSIPECKVVSGIPKKDRDFATVIPNHPKTYIFNRESDYYKDYQRSFFAITCKKAGWDCMRHYEILANGCIPYFLNLEDCDFRTMPFLPKELILEALKNKHQNLLLYP